MDKITIRSPGSLLFAAGSGYMIYLMIQDAYWGYGFIALVGFVLSLVFAKSYTLCEKGIKQIQSVRGNPVLIEISVLCPP